MQTDFQTMVGDLNAGVPPSAPNPQGSAHTPGPWQVIVTKHPHHMGGEHIERSIFTQWHQPQLKGPLPVAGCATGIGAEQSSPAIRFSSISAADARLIAAAPELLAAIKNIVSGLVEADEEGLIEHTAQIEAARAAIAKAEGRA